MIKKNFFLTDLMKLGDHIAFENFIKFNTLEDQEFIFTADYYRLQTFQFEQFHRKFAIIDYRNLHRPMWHNEDYIKDFNYRTEKLHALGFTFIIGHPWESMENVANWSNIDRILAGKKFVHWSGGTSWFWHMMFTKHHDKDYHFVHTDKKFDFLYLNKYPRKHRISLYKKLHEEKILKNSLYTFIMHDNQRLPEEYELPHVDRKNYPNYGFDQEIFSLPYNHSAYNIVAETNNNDSDIFMTEKIWKPIMAKQPFIVHGNFLYLKKLREMGFITFDNVIDESYDLEKNTNKKIELIAQSCKKLLKKDWKSVYADTLEQREHNYKNFWNKEYLSKEINKTVSGFLEFADRS